MSIHFNNNNGFLKYFNSYSEKLLDFYFQLSLHSDIFYSLIFDFDYLDLFPSSSITSDEIEIEFYLIINQIFLTSEFFVIVIILAPLLAKSKGG